MSEVLARIQALASRGEVRVSQGNRIWNFLAAFGRALQF
jgi:hypothetical protein